MKLLDALIAGHSYEAILDEDTNVVKFYIDGEYKHSFPMLAGSEAEIEKAIVKTLYHYVMGEVKTI